MKYIFILNSFTLKDKKAALTTKIEDVCNKRLLDFKIESNSLKTSTEEIVKKYKDEEVILMPVGGDGVVNRTLNSMNLKKNILGFVPHGTGNDFYKSVREQFENGFNECDLVKINDEYFINTACFGIDADIANNSDLVHSRFIPQRQRYNASLLVNFFKYKPRKLKVYINDEIVDDDFTTVILCNGKYYGSGYKVGPTAMLKDDLIDVYLVSKLPKMKMAGLILGMNKGKHEKSNKVKKYQVKKLKIESEERIVANIDGEEIDDRIFDIEVLNKVVNIYYDQGLIDEILN